MRKIFIALALALFSVPALAQSPPSPTFSQGFKPTVAQWNSFFTAKQDTLGYSPLNRAGDRMLGRLSLWPSAVGASGFNVNCGVAPTAPQSGDMWCTTDGLYVQIGTTTVGPLIDSANPVGNFPGITGVGTLTSGATGAGFTVDLSASTLSGTLPATNSGSLTGDVTKSTGTTTTIVAKVNGVAYTSAPSTNTTPVITGANAASYLALPNCATAITYDTSTHLYGCNSTTVSAISGYIYGLQETWASTTTITTSAGSAAASDGSLIMTLGSPVTKTTGAWAAGTGNGCLDTGTIAASTTYHFYLMYDPTNIATSVACSTSASAPTTGGNIPATYTKFRRIYSMMTNGSTQWIKVYQDGDDFVLDVQTQDYIQTNPGTAAISAGPLNVPKGITPFARGVVGNICGASLGTATIVTAIYQADTAPIASGANLAVCSINGRGTGPSYAQTSTTGMVRIRTQQSDASTQIYINTTGWVDRRGRS